MSPLLAAALVQATPLTLAAMGGILSERSGAINIALEGMMLAGAFAGIWAGLSYGLVAGLLGALITGALMGAMHHLATHRLSMDHVVSGVALNMLAFSGTGYLLRRFFTRAQPSRDAYMPAGIPPAVFIVTALVLPFAIHFLLYQTPWGLRLRATGESPESVRMAGVNPVRLRVTGLILSGMLAAFAGAFLSLTPNGRFEDGMVGGRGFIALAAVVCGRWTPLGAAAATLVFGFFESLQFQFQGSVALPGELLRATPYIATILAAALVKSTPPASLGKRIPE